MADNDIRVRLTAKDQASSAIDRLSKRLKSVERPTKTLGHDMSGLSRATSRIGKFSDSFALPRLRQGLRGAGREVSEMRKGLTRLGEGIGSLGELGAVGGIGAGILAATAMSKHWADVGMSTSIAARNIGLTTGQLYRYKRAAALAGVSGGAATQALAAFSQLRFNAAFDPAAAQRLGQLGINARDAHGHLRSIGSLLPQIADKIRALHSGPAQVRFADALGLGPLLPFLRQGGAKIRAEMAELRKEGVGGNFKGFRSLYQDFSKLDTATMKATNVLAQEFAPAIGQATRALTVIANLAGSKDTFLSTAVGPNSFTKWLRKHNLPKELGISVPWQKQAGTRGLRDHNPLNLSYVKGQIGLTGRDGQFGRYRSTSYGIAAATNQLLLDRSRGMDTIRKLVTSWAPPGSNNTAAYIRDVSKWTGYGPDTRLNLRDPAVMEKLVGAMARQEGGGKLKPSDLMAGVRLGYAERRLHPESATPGTGEAVSTLPSSVQDVLDQLRNGKGASGRVTININHTNVPDGVSVKAHSTDSSVVMGGLRISRAMHDEALP